MACGQHLFSVVFTSIFLHIPFGGLVPLNTIKNYNPFTDRGSFISLKMGFCFFPFLFCFRFSTFLFFFLLFYFSLLLSNFDANFLFFLVLRFLFFYSSSSKAGSGTLSSMLSSAGRYTPIHSPQPPSEPRTHTSLSELRRYCLPL